MLRNRFVRKWVVFASIFGFAASNLAFTTTSHAQFGLKIPKKVRLPNISKQLNPGRILKGVAAGAAIKILSDAGLPREIGAVFATTFAGAPKRFVRGYGRKHKKDLRWALIPRGGKRRIIRAPGLKLTKTRRSRAKARITQDTKDIQTALKHLKLYRIKIDGDYGKGTRRAVKKFQKSIPGRQTGTLTAAQRALLFEKAAAVGMALPKEEISVAKPVVIPLLEVNALAPRNIKVKNEANYKLLNSQFDKFTKQYLQVGSLSVVKDAKINTDGVIDLITEEETSNGKVQRKLIGDTRNLVASPHDVTDEWARLVFMDQINDRAYSLNVRDDFNDSDEASKWIAKARKKIRVLAKLTGRETIERKAPVSTAKIVVASNELSQQQNQKAGEGAEQANCRKKIYLSFKFPDGEKPVAHFNITPPENVLMMDNGDSTGFFMGDNICGEYNYKYVYFSSDKKKSKKSWKDNVREGSFKLASNNSQCQVDLMGRDNTANVTCF